MRWVVKVQFSFFSPASSIELTVTFDGHPADTEDVHRVAGWIVRLEAEDACGV